MQLYEFSPTGPTLAVRARWMLQELGVPFESVPVDLRTGANRQPAFLQLNPVGKIPVLVDGERVITESVAILLYLAEKYPEKGLLPRDPGERAQVYRWLLFAATELEKPLWRIVRHAVQLPEEERIPADADAARRDIAPFLEALDGHMRGRQWIVGDRMTVADIVTAFTLDWANEEGLLEQHPTLRTYMERMYARPTAPVRLAVALKNIGL